MTKTSFYFVRHGSTDWNLEKRLMGQMDISLNTEGIAQAKQARAFFASKVIASLCTSPLLRAKETAQIINEELKLSLIEIDELKECNWGEFQGLSLTAQQFQEWEGGKVMKGGESYRDFIKRVGMGLQKALDLPSPVLIVAHGIVYQAILLHLGLPKCIDIPHCTPIYHSLKRIKNAS